MNLEMDFGAWYADITRQADLRIQERVQSLMQGRHRSVRRGAWR